MQLSDTRTHDKRLTLLHFIVQTIDEKFPDLIRFDNDLQAVEKAAQGLNRMKAVVLFPNIPFGHVLLLLLLLSAPQNTQVRTAISSIPLKDESVKYNIHHRLVFQNMTDG